MRYKIRLKTASLTLLALSVCMSVCGCSFRTRTIYVKQGDPVQIRKTVKDADIWALDGKGERVPSNGDLQEGSWVLSDPGPK